MSTKTGYVPGPLKLFYLSDQKDWDCPYHYHDFDKITIFLQGHVTYDIEGKSYALQPYDIVVVPRGQLHRPLIRKSAVYERIIAYIAPSFYGPYKNRCDFAHLFQLHHGAVLRQSLASSDVYTTTCRLRQAFSQTGAAATLLQETLFLEFLLYLYRACQEHTVQAVKTGQSHPKIQQLISYIQDHLAGDLSIPTIAKAMYMSPDYMMHLFKDETGSSLGNYITVKRLQRARYLIEQHVPLTTVCYDSGFKNYSTFYRAFKKQYHVSPKSGMNIPTADASYTE